MVDEKMTIGLIISILADKNHVRLNTDLAVIEHMPELFMGKYRKVPKFWDSKIFAVIYLKFKQKRPNLGVFC